MQLTRTRWAPTLVLGVVLACALVSRVHAGDSLLDCIDALEKLKSLSYGPGFTSEEMIVASGHYINDAGKPSLCYDLNAKSPTGNLTHYCLTEVSVKGLNVNLGLCLPTACSQDTAEALLAHVNLTLHDAAGVGSVDCQKADYTLKPGAIATLALCGFLGSLMLVGTFVDYATREPVLDDDDKKLVAERLSINAEAGERLLSNQARGDDDDGAAAKRNDDLVKVPKKKESLVVRFLKCWSVPYNVVKLVQPTPGNLTSLNGLRAVSISLIVLGHSGLYLADLGVQNVKYAFQDVFQRLSVQMIAGAEFSVDSFFFLSGFLVAYGLLGQLDKRKGRIPWGMFFFHRVWRLTPCYAFVMLFYITVSPLLGSGPLWHRYQMTLGINDTVPENTCSKYWWTNLLYISNFYPTQFEYQCFKWGWYLSVDTQFYILSPIFLVLFYKKRSLGVIVTVATMIASVAIRGTLVLVNDLSYNGAGTNHVLNEIYAKPWGRISPYMIGLLVAFTIKAKPHWRIRNQAIAFITHVIAWAVIGACWLGKYSYFHRNRHWNPNQSFFYLTFARFAFSLSVGFLWHASFVSKTNYIRVLLGARVWAPLARLTYNTYLIHPALINLTYYTQPNFVVYTDWVLAYFFVGNLVLAFALATIVFLAVERPFMNLERILFH